MFYLNHMTHMTCSCYQYRAQRRAILTLLTKNCISINVCKLRPPTKKKKKSTLETVIKKVKYSCNRCSHGFYALLCFYLFMLFFVLPLLLPPSLPFVDHALALILLDPVLKTLFVQIKTPENPPPHPIQGHPKRKEKKK